MRGLNLSRWCGLLLGGLLVLCWCGTAEAALGDIAVEEAIDAAAAAEEEIPRGIIPVRDYSGDVWSRRALTGDWGGTRQEWAEKGVTIELDWFQVGQGIVKGGIDERWAYSTNLDYYLKFDLMRMGLVPGAVVTVRGQSRFGTTVNGDTGLLLPVNNYSFFPFTSEIDRNIPITITEFNWLQLLSEHVGVLLGKITTLASTNEFAGGEGKSQFMNFQFMYSAVLAQVAPYSTLAAGGVWMPSEHVTVTTLLMNVSDSSTTSGFEDFGEGASWATTVDTRYELGDLPGGASAGFIYAFNGEFAQIGGIYIRPPDGISLDTASTTWAFYLSSWQYLFTEEPAEAVDPANGSQDLEGLGLFAILGFGDRDANPVTWSISAGLGGRGSIPGRADDTWGLAFFHNDLQDKRTFLFNQLSSSVKGLEVYYNIAVADWAELTLDFQWVDSAIRGVDDSFILGLRLSATF